MFIYQLKTALLSIKRNPFIAGLLACAIAIGVAMSTASLAVYTIYLGNPIPNKSERLFYVQLDSWSVGENPVPSDPRSPPLQITYRDMVGIMQSHIPTYQGGMFSSILTVFPDKEGQRPFRSMVRLCFNDFFPMFEVPFAYGGPWDEKADSGPEQMIVLDAKTNLRLFGGQDSVGRILRIEDRDFTIVGVLKPWRPTPRFYDPISRSVDNEPEGIFMPFRLLKVFEFGAGSVLGRVSCHSQIPGPTFEDYLQSECTWIQMWVQLDSRRQKDSYFDFLNAYALEQKKLGRFSRPLNNRLRSVMGWLQDREVVPEGTRGILILSLLFLVVCAVNLIGILLGKFLARVPEVGVRRALGASKASVFLQHLLECEIVGLLGGLLGIGLSVIVLDFVNRELETHGLFQLDSSMLAAGCALSLGAGLLAGLYPAWRICRMAPATHLKLQ
jgi:putative ABC transport system permease protein